MGQHRRPCAMRTRRIVIPAMVGALALLVVYLSWPDRNAPFARFICSPVPPSVRILLLQNNDWLGMNPEPVCYLAFTASPEDIATIVNNAQFQRVSKDSLPVPSGPDGWRSADQLGPDGRVYGRTHAPRSPGSRLYIGSNRRWSEFLWVDETGTNAYFLLWG